MTDGTNPGELLTDETLKKLGWLAVIVVGAYGAATWIKKKVESMYKED